MVLSALRRLLAGSALLAVAGAHLVTHAPAVAADRPATRRVNPGETLSGVAASLGVSVANLAQVNGITDVHRIRAGDRLVVPRRGTKPPAGTAPAAPAAKATKAATSSTPAGLPDRLRQQPARLALLPHFDAAAREFAVPADLFKALTWLESGWQNDKVSSTKALGIGQLMPDTVAFVNGVLLRARLDPRVPRDNIRLSARFLAYLLRQTRGDVPLALASYYQGLASVRRLGVFPETHRYVANVLALRQKF